MNANNNENHIDKLFNQKLVQHELDAPKGSWEAIEQSLNGKNTRPLFPFWRRVAVAAVILALIGSIEYLRYSGYQSNKALITQKKPTPIQEKSKHSAVKENTIPVNRKINNHAILLAENEGRSVLGSTGKHITNNNESIKRSNSVSQPSGVAKQVIQPESTINKTRIASQRELEIFSKEGTAKTSINQQTTSKHRRSSLGLLAVFFGSSTHETKANYTSFRSTSNTDKVFAMMNAAGFNSDNGESFARHSLPIAIGLSIEKEIGNRFSIQTGITGSYLRSTQSQQTSLYFTDEIQELYYLGLPLAIAYRFMETERFSFYMKSGGVIEKNIAGRWQERIRKEDEYIFTKLEHDLENKLQWSAQIGAGANYQISGKMNIYLEPAVSYYFDNHSNIDNIRKQQKLDLTLQAGLRAIFDSH